ncbi:hypothetical protein A4X09_0g5885 [Tilletia walkeri]|uniref:NADAR domain-containing protein n=1 Tax=Tilletia walkeri TaxID=117179 RepID=A0A8X7N6B7_9BASI|nr:hypothetical protein A4X09_0g5885 [Tilletia walkeri]
MPSTYHGGGRPQHNRYEHLTIERVDSSPISKKDQRKRKRKDKGKNDDQAQDLQDAMDLDPQTPGSASPDSGTASEQDLKPRKSSRSAQNSEHTEAVFDKVIGWKRKQAAVNADELTMRLGGIQLYQEMRDKDRRRHGEKEVSAGKAVVASALPNVAGCPVPAVETKLPEPVTQAEIPAPASRMDLPVSAPAPAGPEPPPAPASKSSSKPSPATREGKKKSKSDTGSQKPDKGKERSIKSSSKADDSTKKTSAPPEEGKSPGPVSPPPNQQQIDKGKTEGESVDGSKQRSTSARDGDNTAPDPSSPPTPAQHDKKGKGKAKAATRSNPASVKDAALPPIPEPENPSSPAVEAVVTEPVPIASPTPAKAVKGHKTHADSSSQTVDGSAKERSTSFGTAASYAQTLGTSSSFKPGNLFPPISCPPESAPDKVWGLKDSAQQSVVNDPSIKPILKREGAWASDRKRPASEPALTFHAPSTRASTPAQRSNLQPDKDIDLTNPVIVNSKGKGNQNIGTMRFYNRGEPGFYLTNFYETPLILDGQTYWTSEAYFQSRKFPDDPVLIRRIASAASARIALQLATANRYRVRKDWIQVSVGEMFDAVLLKFIGNSQLRSLLLDTGEAHLIEAAPTDSFWGEGIDGKGRNELGHVLMKVRTALRTIDDLRTEAMNESSARSLGPSPTPSPSSSPAKEEDPNDEKNKCISTGTTSSSAAGSGRRASTVVSSVASSISTAVGSITRQVGSTISTPFHRFMKAKQQQ